MSIVDNFDKILYSSLWTVDKVTHTGEMTIVNDGDSDASQSAKIVEEYEENPTGRLCYIRAAWSLDGDNWNPVHTRLTYMFTVNYSGMFGTFSTDSQGLSAAVSVGCSNSQVVARTANGLHGTVTADDVGETYTPTSQTFYIRYALFEVE